ncbi:DUF4381 domain-containing protein [Salinimicrobium soli]|uniref:DUF4381 domain-containing protein n=1 Tax=Salinimicrobium soli TaxID=1254399 RepID=UPI003AAB5216
MNQFSGSKYKAEISPKIVVVFLCAFFFLAFCTGVRAQEVKAGIDSTSIKIGEQITYSISVETSPDELVVFPEGQTFSPLEMIESYPVDTSRAQDRLRLFKEYALTQFDSGRYTIPRQRVIIGQKSFFTDSIPVEVNNVVVDTTKQKMFPIKPSVEVPEPFRIPEWVWWLLGIALILVVAGYLLFRRKKRKEAAAQKLPPYEQALLELRQLDDSHLLEQREIKEYYSQLSAAVRRYLDGEIYDHALESTTNELIVYLEHERDKGKLKLEHSTIEHLKEILERADLAKFANSKPDVLTAKEDRSRVENVINDTKASIPEPSEEELLRDQEYREKEARKKKVKKIIFGVLAVVLLLSAGIAYVISTEGYSSFVDNYIGNRSKDLLEGEWIRSEYGSPPVAITTPEVLTRSLADTTALTSGKEDFEYGSFEKNLYIDLSTRPAGKDFNAEAAVEEVYTFLESRGAKNIITKQEEITTLNGAKGVRIFGTMNFEEKAGKTIEKAYSILNFGVNDGFQQIVVVYNIGDKYAEEISQRITDSVELINPES